MNKYQYKESRVTQNHTRDTTKGNNKALTNDPKEIKIYGMLMFKKMRIILPKL